MAVLTVKSIANDRFNQFVAILPTNPTFLSWLLTYWLNKKLCWISLLRGTGIWGFCVLLVYPATRSAFCTSLTTLMAFSQELINCFQFVWGLALLYFILCKNVDVESNHYQKKSAPGFCENLENNSLFVSRLQFAALIILIFAILTFELWSWFSAAQESNMNILTVVCKLV